MDLMEPIETVHERKISYFQDIIGLLEYTVKRCNNVLVMKIGWFSNFHSFFSAQASLSLPAKTLLNCERTYGSSFQIAPMHAVLTHNAKCLSPSLELPLTSVS